jgi:hypothetical protein
MILSWLHSLSGLAPWLTPAAYRQMAITEVASFFYFESKACRMTSLMSDSPTANEIIGCFSTFGPSQPSITIGSIEV